MACTGCQTARNDLKKAVSARDVRAAGKAIGAGVSVALAKIKPPPVTPTPKR